MDNNTLGIGTGSAGDNVNFLQVTSSWGNCPNCGIWCDIYNHLCLGSIHWNQYTLGTCTETAEQLLERHKRELENKLKELKEKKEEFNLIPKLEKALDDANRLLKSSK